jgi:hypothetical protein
MDQLGTVQDLALTSTFYPDNVIACVLALTGF